MNDELQFEGCLSSFSILGLLTLEPDHAESELKLAFLLFERLNFFGPPIYYESLVHFVRKHSSLPTAKIEQSTTFVDPPKEIDSEDWISMLSKADDLQYDMKIAEQCAPVHLRDVELNPDGTRSIDGVILQYVVQPRVYVSLLSLINIVGMRLSPFLTTLDQLAFRELFGVQPDQPDLQLSATKLLGVPDVGSLSWKDIFHLREHSGINEYRRAVAGYADLETRTETLEKLYQEQLLANDKLVPDPAGSRLAIIIANLPIPAPVPWWVPIPNPVGAIRDIQSLRASRRFHQAHPFISFVTKVRKKAPSRIRYAPSAVVLRIKEEVRRWRIYWSVMKEYSKR